MATVILHRYKETRWSAEWTDITGKVHEEKESSRVHFTITDPIKKEALKSSPFNSSYEKDGKLVEAVKTEYCGAETYAVPEGFHVGETADGFRRRFYEDNPKVFGFPYFLFGDRDGNAFISVDNGKTKIYLEKEKES